MVLLAEIWMLLNVYDPSLVSLIDMNASRHAWFRLFNDAKVWVHGLHFFADPRSVRSVFQQPINVLLDIVYVVTKLLVFDFNCTQRAVFIQCC